MGMHYGFVAVTSTVERFVGVFSEVWPKHEISGRATLSSIDEFVAWQRENERVIPAKDWTPDNPGGQVYGFVQDGEWAVFLDASYVLASDQEAQAKLSEAFGTCVSFVIETTGGAASFMAFKQGRLVRRIDSVDGEVTTEGDPIPQEAGMAMDEYYMDEAEELQRRLGIRFLGDAPPTQVLAVATIDRTDYSALMQAVRAAEARPKKPWWQLW